MEEYLECQIYVLIYQSNITVETIEISYIFISLTSDKCSLRTDLTFSETAGKENSNKFPVSPKAELKVVSSIFITGIPMGAKSKADGFSGFRHPCLNVFKKLTKCFL